MFPGRSSQRAESAAVIKVDDGRSCLKRCPCVSEMHGSASLFDDASTCDFDA